MLNRKIRGPLMLATLLLALVGALCKARTATACDSAFRGFEDRMLGATLVCVAVVSAVTADAAMTVMEFTRLPAWPSERKYGIAQVAIALPQAVLFSSFAMQSYARRSYEAGTLMAGMTLWSAVLTGRGMYHIYSARAANPELSLAPLLLNGGRGSSPGAMLSGRF